MSSARNNESSANHPEKLPRQDGKNSKAEYQTQYQEYAPPSKRRRSGAIPADENERIPIAKANAPGQITSEEVNYRLQSILLMLAIWNICDITRVENNAIPQRDLKKNREDDDPMV